MLRVFSLILLTSFSIFAGDLSGKYEVSAFGGTTNPVNSESGHDGNFGGNFGYGVNSKTTVFGEFTRNVGGFHFFDAHGGLKQTLLTRGRFEPYVLGGLGIARPRVFVGSANSFSVNAGFGARFYISQRWGVQPEFRWLHFFQRDFNDVNLLRITAGIFFQWGGE